MAKKIDPLKVDWSKLGYIGWHAMAIKLQQQGIRQSRCEHGYWLWPGEKCSAHGKEDMRCLLPRKSRKSK